MYAALPSKKRGRDEPAKADGGAGKDVMLETTTTPPEEAGKSDPAPHAAVVRFAGESGDGVQVLGTEFAKSSALAGHGLMTFPEFPAEIRAPAGTTFGVSAYQIQFGGDDVRTHGELADVLVAFNPAALKTNLTSLRRGGTIVADEGAFTPRNLDKAGYAENPLEDGSLDGYQILPIDITRLTHEAVADTGVGRKQATRSKNFWALGFVYWMFGRRRGPTKEWPERRFAAMPEVAAANIAALDGGHIFGETSEIDVAPAHRPIAKAEPKPGTYRTVTGTDAIVYGIAAVAALSGLKVTYCSYPITPASAMLHGLARLKGKGVQTFQAEDEIAAAGAAIGASYAGGLGVVGSSGPGIALKAESLSLAVAAELPLVVIDVQRAGPSTGMPTKPEQADLFMAVHGRHGESPMPVFAPARVDDCFDVVIRAAQVAMTYMTPVMILSDAYLANAAQPWLLPDVSALPDLTPEFRTDTADFQPFQRNDKTLARPWAVPGTPGLAHRVGGLERAADSGHISYDPDNHAQMTALRAEKMDRIAEDQPAASVAAGAESGDLVVVGWGATYGALRAATEDLCAEGHNVGHVHLTQLWPLPRGLDDLLKSYRQVIVAELNTGQLRALIRDRYLIDARGLNQVTGQPFSAGTVYAALQAALDETP